MPAQKKTAFRWITFASILGVFSIAFLWTVSDLNKVRRDDSQLAPENTFGILGVSSTTQQQQPQTFERETKTPFEKIQETFIDEDQVPTSKDLQLEVSPSTTSMPTRVVLFGACTGNGWKIASRTGGPKGEITVCNSLKNGLLKLGVDVTEAESHNEFRGMLSEIKEGKRQPFDLFFFDPWTFHDSRKDGYLDSLEKRVLIMEFFGVAPQIAPEGIDVKQYLNPYPNAHNTFLGFVVKFQDGCAKKDQGVVWGKEAKYFLGYSAMLEAIAERTTLYTTVSPERGYYEGMVPHNVHNLGALDEPAWEKLLCESRFVIGLGDPVAGPTAIEALASGALYINPEYPSTKFIYNNEHIPFTSQHPFLAKDGGSHVCTTRLDDFSGVLDCVDRALARNEPKPSQIPVIRLYSEAEYMQRLTTILQDSMVRARS